MTVEQTQRMEKVCYFDLGLTQLAVMADHNDLLGGFERFLGERGRPDTSDCTFTVTIRTGEMELLPPDAELLFSGSLPDEGRCDFTRAGETYFVSFPGEARMVVDLPARRADIVVLQDCHWRVYGTMVPIVVEFALDLEDQQVVHAAGLSIPGEEGIVLVSAPSGTGKTTTALALARCGLRFAADDIMVLRRQPAAIFAWGLPRPLNVHRQTATMMPWLNLPSVWDEEGEQMVPRCQLAAAVALENRALPVTRLVLLQRGGRAAVEPLESSEMLAALATDNVRNSTSGLTPLQERRFAMLTDLVRVAPAYRVTTANGLSCIKGIADWLKG